MEIQPGKIGNRSTLVLLSLVLVGALIPAVNWAMTPDVRSADPSGVAWARITREPELAAALSLMTTGPGAQSLGRIQRGPIRLGFKDMATIAEAYKDYDALAWMNRNGELAIFVNEKHRQAPPQALAALLAHEAIHDDAANSMQEEIRGWNLEASAWQFYCQGTPGLYSLRGGPDTLIYRLNRLMRAQGEGSLERLVRSNPGYRALPETTGVARGL